MNTRKRFEILYAEDDPSTRESVRDFLASSGYSVLAVGDGQQLLDAYVAVRGKFDCIVSGFSMKPVDGLTALQQIRARGLKTPFIMYTYGGGGAVKAVVELEGGVHVSKRAPIRVLLAAVEKAVQKK